MKVYTTKDLKRFKKDEQGRLICPTGDYTAVYWFKEPCVFDQHCTFGDRTNFSMCSVFGSGCSFGSFCSFGESCIFSDRCRFGEACRFGDMCRLAEPKLEQKKIKQPIERVLKIEGIGSQKRCTYFFKTSSEIYVRCGCFFGDIEEFEAKVNDKHAANEIYRKEYLEAIKFVKLVI